MGIKRADVLHAGSSASRTNREEAIGADFASRVYFRDRIVSRDAVEAFAKCDPSLSEK
jgi:hypothetical protein